MPKRVSLEQNVWDLARERMEETFKIFDTVAVSFSGGKDSTCVLHVTLDTAKAVGWTKPIPIVFFDEEAIPFETEHYVRRVAAKYGQEIDLRWYCLPVKHRNGCSRAHPYWYPWTQSEKELWVRPLPPEAITTIPGFPTEEHQGYSIPDTMGLIFSAKEYGQVGITLGIRGQESLTRLRIFLHGLSREYLYMVPYMPDTNNIGLQQNNVTKVYPVYDWTTEDVWTAPKIHGWDYNRAYDIMSQLGMTPHYQRCAPPYGEEPMRGLYQFALCFPDIWDKMQGRVPGAATAARYARTELYGYVKWPDKIEGKTWKETIVHYLNHHDSKSRTQIAERLEGEINRHYSKTIDPIVGYAAHPMTGVSWKWLVMIASRGDLKFRKKPLFSQWHTPHDPETKKAFDKYREEQDCWEEE